VSVIIDHVTKVFESPDDPSKRVVAVNNVTLKIEEGEMVTLLGPSGCGKTTTLRMVAGFELPTEGRISIGGVDVTYLPPNKRDTAMIFQSYAIFPHLSVKENVAFGLRLKKGLSEQEIEARVQRMLEMVGLSGMANRSPDQLSGGQQQRVALARAIVNEPSVLLFDEPLSNLDAKLREQMRHEIRALQQRLGITSLYVTHDQSEAMTLSDRIVVMRDGNIEQVGTPVEIYTRPATRFVASFIGTANLIPARVEQKGGQGITLRLGEKTLEVPEPEAPVQVGEMVDLVVRPEALRLMAPGSGLLQGRVRRRAYLGSVAEYAIEAGELELMATVTNPLEQGLLAPGEYVGLDFPGRSVHILRQEG